MPSKRIQVDLNDGVYFLTFTVRNWYYLFDRYHRWGILVNSLNYCRENKGLKIYHYVLMFNHLHLVVESPDMSGFVRDFKRFTSRKLYEKILATESNVLALFERNAVYQFWQKTTMPIKLESEAVYLQKARYVEQNPIRKGYVFDPAHWVYSSANADSPVVLDVL